MAHEKIKATASVTIVDETDASILTGNMLVVKGSKKSSSILVALNALSNIKSFPQTTSVNIISFIS